MTREEILGKLKEIFLMAVSAPSSLPENIGEDANLHTDLGMTSINLLYIVIAIEEMFQINFDSVGMSDFDTVGQVIDYISEKL